MREEYTPTENPPGELPGVWRERAALLKEYGDPNCARLWALAATELDAALQVLDEDTLSLVQAARESGYSVDHLGSLVRRGEIPNAGRRNAPRIRPADLPIKSPTSPGRPPTRRRKAAAGDVDIRSITNKLR